MLVQFGFDVRRIDVGSVFDGNFNRFKAPFLERLEQGGAVIGERRGEEEGIDAKSHNGKILIFSSLRQEARVSNVFRFGFGQNTGEFDTISRIYVGRQSAENPALATGGLPRGLEPLHRSESHTRTVAPPSARASSRPSSKAQPLFQPTNTMKSAH